MQRYDKITKLLFRLVINNLKEGDWVFIKGSRAMELDKIVTELKELRSKK